MIEQLTRRWVTAWTHARGLASSEVEGWPLVEVGLASRATELVCAEPAPEVWSALVARIAHRPEAMLSLVARDPDRYLAGLPAGVRVDREDETLMSHRLGTSAPRPADVSAYGLDREEHDGRITVRLTTDEAVVAEGTVGVCGRDAAYDMVETSPGYRRRGLAGWVMSELDRIARERGAETGLLVATAQGAALYRSLGWSSVAPMRSLMGTG